MAGAFDFKKEGAAASWDRQKAAIDGPRVRAYAKINPVLDIVGRREDGYHLVRMLLHTVGVADELRFVFDPLTEGKTDFYLTKASTEEGRRLVDAKDNLVLRAVEWMRARNGITCSMDIELHKQIPVAAGMAGGSTDAAATLWVLERCFPRPDRGEEATEALRAEALCLGADVPYCLGGGCCLAEGIGEKLTALPTLSRGALVLAKPPAAVSTAEIYRAFDAEKEVRHPDVDAAVEAIARDDLLALSKVCGNVLEPVTERFVPQIGEIRRALSDAGAEAAFMTGSGPTMCGLFLEEERAGVAALALQKRFPDCRVLQTGFVSGTPKPF